MEDFDQGVTVNLSERCAICGATLREAEIEAARESGGPFLCAVHADELVPAEETVAGDEPEA